MKLGGQPAYHFSSCSSAQYWNSVPQHAGKGATDTSVEAGRCTCLQCGREFPVQRHGALYLCERCENDSL